VFRGWWKDGVARDGFFPTLRWFLKQMWEFARDSTPARRRQRYDDVDYDWDYRVDTTSATVGWRQRLLGVFLSGYQATEPAAQGNRRNTPATGKATTFAASTAQIRV
jgi:hypothetical protein